VLQELKDGGVKQPMLIRITGQYYIKTDNTAIALPGCSCFLEALEYLFMTFFVFDVQYPSELRFFFGFIERLLEIKSTIKSSTVTDLLRKLMLPVSPDTSKS
jgi:hypothetical protein